MSNYPSYLDAAKNGKLDKITKQLYDTLESCVLCPRKCKVNRLKNNLGFCKTGLKPKVFSYLSHQGEEPPVSGTNGSGTIFFSNCNMACAYCQNYEFSQLGQGKEIGCEELAEFMMELQKASCHNINLVTPTHILPQILKALSIAISKGLNIPIVYNTSGYELPQIIKLLDGIIDIYLTDMRYGDKNSAVKFSCARDYPKYNQLSVIEMFKQVGIAQFNNNDIIERGLIIRHLVLPNNTSSTEEIMKFVYKKISPDIHISLMSQYLPYHKAIHFKEIDRRLKYEEYEEAKSILDKYGLHNGWTQESLGLERFAGVHIKSVLK